MKAQKIVAIAERIDTGVTVFSTGQHPEREKDLLLLGNPTRDDFFDQVAGSFADEAAIVRSDDALIIDDGAKVGAAYYDNDLFLHVTRTIAEGSEVDPVVKHWSLGPWLPETFASDLSRALLLNNGNSEVIASVRQFDTYPEGMRDGIRQRCLAEIGVKAAFIESSENRQSLIYASQLTDLCLAGLRLIYANEGVYFRGLRYEEQTRDQLSGQGQRFSSRLADIQDYTVVDLLF